MKRKKRQKPCHFKTPPSYLSRFKTHTFSVEIVELEDNSFHMIVPVEIDGMQGDMILDTGASVSVVDDRLFHADPLSETDVQMSSGSVTGQIHNVRLVKAAKFKLGGRTLKEIQLAAIDLKYVNEMYDKHLHRKIIGLLGCDFCVRYKVLIDYQNKEISMHF